MTREDVIKNIMATYGKYGLIYEAVEEEVKRGEEHGFSYESIFVSVWHLGMLQGRRNILL